MPKQKKPHLEQVAERQPLQRGSARHFEHAEQIEPVLGGEGFAANPLQTRRQLLVDVNVLLDLELHGARLRALAYLFAETLLPDLKEFVELVGFGAEADPVLLLEFAHA